MNLISGTISKFGRLDYLVNNAGGQFRNLAEFINSKGWNAVIGLNLTGTFTMCREGGYSGGVSELVYIEKFASS